MNNLTSLRFLSACFIIIFAGCGGGSSDESSINETDSPTYTVTYNSNGADGGSVPVDSNEYEEGESVTVLGNTSDMVLNNSAFTGWNTASDGSGTDYAAGSALTMGSADLTLYAQWEAVDYTSLFSDASAGLTGVYHSSSCFGDVDGDGDQDLVITGDDGNTYISRLYTNNGFGSFSDASAGLTGVEYGSSSFGDIDGDGDLDLLITGDDDTTYTATLYTNDGLGGFSDASAGLTGVYLGSSSFGDVDGDGDLDLVITGDDDTTYISKLYTNNGSGTFSDASAGLTGVRYSFSSFGDIDGDGDLDLVITGRDTSSDESATLYTNDGSGSFSDASAGLTGVQYSCSSFGDIDGDGDLDLVITGWDDTGNMNTTLYTNNGSGSFTDVSAGLTDVYRGSISFGDVDNDSDLDLLITGIDSSLHNIATLYINDGSGGFTIADAGLTGVSYSSSSFSDVDGDGDLDLLITGYGSDYSATLYINGLY